MPTPALNELINIKFRQYGTTKPTVAAVIDDTWVRAKKFVNNLPINYETVLSDWIDKHISQGVLEDLYYKKIQPSDKKLKNLSDLEYWGVLQRGGNRLLIRAPYWVCGEYELEMVVYFTQRNTVKCAFYAMFNKQLNFAYQAFLEDNR